jgi:hypothetical protein
MQEVLKLPRLTFKTFQQFVKKHQVKIELIYAFSFLFFMIWLVFHVDARNNYLLSTAWGCNGSVICINASIEWANDLHTQGTIHCHNWTCDKSAVGIPVMPWDRNTTIYNLIGVEK